jgi:PhnB protein
MKLNPHLSFDGRCEEAFTFYEKLFGGKILFTLTYERSPMAEQVPADWRKKICHTTFAIDNMLLTGADTMTEDYRKPQGVSVLLQFDDVAEAERIFNSLARNGEIQKPIQETFWAVRFGMVVDQFGTPWIINCGRVGM